VSKIQGHLFNEKGEQIMAIRDLQEAFDAGLVIKPNETLTLRIESNPADKKSYAMKIKGKGNK